MVLHTTLRKSQTWKFRQTIFRWRLFQVQGVCQTQDSLDQPIPSQTKNSWFNHSQVFKPGFWKLIILLELPNILENSSSQVEVLIMPDLIGASISLKLSTLPPPNGSKFYQLLNLAIASMTVSKWIKATFLQIFSTVIIYLEKILLTQYFRWNLWQNSSYKKDLSWKWCCAIKVACLERWTRWCQQCWNCRFKRWRTSWPKRWQNVCFCHDRRKSKSK